MNLGQMINSFRAQIGEQSVRRFTTAIVTDWANRAQMQVAYEVDFPEATQTITTVAGQQEYQLVELMKILRVYIQGPNGAKQELFGTDIFTLEGDILQQYDNSSGIIQGQPNQSSMFSQAPVGNYPVLNVPISGQGSGPVPTKSSYSFGSRPSYYLRGGFIGIAPAPGTMNPQYLIGVDHIPKPPALNVSSDLSIYPDIFLDAVVWKMIAYASYSDNTSAYADATKLFENEMMMKIRPWLDSIQATKPKTLVPRTVRSQFRLRRGYLP